MTTRSLLLAAVALAASACATAATPGRPLRDAGGPLRALADEASFDHGCPKERIRFVKQTPTAVDLDVCGDVRRYKAVSGPDDAAPVTWLDVTAAYPRNVLPQPLPAAGQ